MPHSTPSRRRAAPRAWLALPLLALLALLAAPAIFERASAADNPLRQAWERVRDGGAYHYTARVDIALRPQPRLENVGLHTTHQHLAIDGQVDMRRQSLDMRIASGAPITGGNGAIELHSADGVTRSRVGDAPWKTSPLPTGAFAPGNDFMAYLAAARGIGEAKPENRGGVALSHYTFDIDGPAFAALMQSHLQDELARNGTLPPGARLDMARAYAGMTGSGEAWLNADGLPLRQIVRVSIPDDLRGQTTDATFTADFGGFPAITPTAQSWRWLAALNWGAALLNAALLALILVGIAAIARAPRSRPAYALLALLSVCSIVAGPLLDAQRSVASAAERAPAPHQSPAAPAIAPAPRQAPFDPHAAPLAPARPAPASLAAPNGPDSDNDGLSDAQEAQIGSTATITDTDKDGLSDGIEALELGTRPTAWDTDGDGLGDGLEVGGFSGPGGRTWYLDPFNPDSNNDGQPDLNECVGATFCPDTDADGTPDAFDDDNDGDGVPDRLDASPTVAVSGGPAPGGGLLGLGDAGFALDARGFTPGKPLLADFTIRPVNPAHLWYNGSVLDWPSDDREGQVQRVFDTTFGATGSAANGDMRLAPMLEITIPYANGAVGGLPLRAGVTSVPPPPAATGRPSVDAANQEAWVASWLDKEKMDSYQVAVRIKDSATILAYVPLDMLRDPDSDVPVAFSARMFYRPNAPALGPQKLRLSWAVQMKLDRCTTPPAADNAQAETLNRQHWDSLPADQKKGDYVPWEEQSASARAAIWCADTANWQTSDSPVHAYYDDFTISALDLREELGLNVAVALQHPSAGTSPVQPSLWNLARGLDQAFVAGRDCDTLSGGGACQGNGQRDITIAEIKRRFDRASNAGVPNAARWNIPAGDLAVTTYAFEEEGDLGRLSTGHMANGQPHNPYLVDLLNATYVANGAASVANPTALIAREATSRSASLNNGATLAAGSVAFDLAGIPTMTQASLNWQPFSYKGASTWAAEEVDQFWNSLDARYTPPLTQYGGTVGRDAASVAGGADLLKHFALALMSGRSQLVAVEGVPVAPASQWRPDTAIQFPTGAPATLGALAEEMAALVIGSQKHRALLLDADASALLTALGRQRLYQDGGAALSLFQGLGDLTSGNSGNQLLNATLASAARDAEVATPDPQVSLYYAEKQMNNIALGINALDTIDAALGTVETFRDWKQSVQIAKQVKDLMRQAETATESIELLADLTTQQGNLAKAVSKVKEGVRPPKSAAVIAIVVEVVTAVGRLVALVQADNVNFDNVAAIVVHGIAGFVVGYYLLGTLAAIVPIGTIIAAIIAIIDVVIAAICGFTSIGESEGWWAKTFCEGISGNAARIITAIFYFTNPLADMQAPNRLNMVNWQFTPRDPLSGQDRGFIASSELGVRTDIVTTLTPDSLSVARSTNPYLPTTPIEQVTRKLANATFRYEFTTAAEKDDQRIHKRRNLDTKQMVNEWRRSGITQVVTQSVGITLTLDRAGINWKPDALFLAEGMATPSVQCTGSACRTYTEDDSTYMNIANSVVFDVFPPTLDAFYALSDRGGGAFALGWDARFPTLADADNDGLRSKAVGGNDPNDNSPDSDNDGLSDFYELQHAGQGFDPNRADSDNDGLSDAAEARLRTNPGMADGDGDGLPDGAEIAGWEVVYGYDAQNRPLRFRATSDPFSADTDNDGILDNQEKTYGFNPRVFNSNTVLTMLSQIDERDGAADGIVSDNSLIGYSATISNTLRDRHALGLFEVSLPSEASGGIPARSYLLGPRERATLSGELALRDLPSSAKTTLVNRAGAIIADLRALADGRVVWLHLDEESGATRFADSSLFDNHAGCAGAGCPTAGRTSYSGRGVQIQNSGAATLLRVPHSASLPTDRFTFSLWIKPVLSASYQDILAKQAGAGAQVSYVLGMAPNTLKARLAVQNQSCAAGASVLESANAMQPGVWNLLSATYDGAALRVYINGIKDGELAYNGGICDNTAPLDIGKIADTSEVDEVSVYPFALSDSEVLAQFRDPILLLNFDGTTADSSQLRQPTSVKGRDSISLPSLSVGRAAQFDKKRWLEVGPNPELDLSRGAGTFTLAAWMRPVPLGPDLNRWLGVLGRESGTGGATTYPSLQVNFSSTNSNGTLRAVFGNGNTRCESAATGAWLAPGQWQHVAVAFTRSQFIFFLNGQQREALPLPANCLGNPRPASGTSFQIGRTAPDARLELQKIFVNDEGDASSTAEYDGYWDGNGFWSRDNIDDVNDSGPWDCGAGCYNSVGGTLSIGDDNAHTYRLMEDDGSTGLDSSDDELVNQSLRNTDITTGSSDGTATWNYNADGSGTVTYRLWNDFYNGDLDDVGVYRYALSQSDVAALYQANSRAAALQLRFEEPPTSWLFRDGSGNGLHALCAGGCPTSGLPGRDGQAVRFDGTQAVEVADRPPLDLPNSFTLASWVKLDAVTGNQTIARKLDATLGGFVLSVQNGQLVGELRDARGNRYEARGGSVTAGAWTHLALTATAGGYLIAYVNGQEAARAPLKATGSAVVAEGQPREAFTSATLWGDKNLAANSSDVRYTVTGDISDLPYHEQNETSSVGIGDACIDLYWDNNYGGNRHVVCDNTGDLGASDDQIDSVRFYKTPAAATGSGVYFNQYQRQSVVIDQRKVGEPNFSSITIAARVDLTTTSGTYTVAARGNNSNDFDNGTMDAGFRFDIVNGRLRFSAGGGTWQSGGTIDANEHHVAVALGGGQVRFFIDGAPSGTSSFGGNVNDTPDRPLLLGRAPDCGARTWCDFFDGRVRDVAFYARPLSDAEVVRLRDNQPEYVDSAGRVAYLPLDEASGAKTFSMPTIEPLATNSAPLVVGRDARGFFDELTLIETALPQSDISDLMGEAPVVNLALDEPNGATTFDNQSPGLPDAIGTGAATPKAGAKGRIRDALVLDGGDDQIALADDTEFDLRRYTIELWVRPNAIKAGPQPLVAKARSSLATVNYRLEIAPGGLNLRLTTCTAQLTSAKPLNQAQWNHIAATYDGFTMRLYINGTLDSTTSRPFLYCPVYAPINVGAIPGYGTPFDGTLDELVIYNRALDAAAVGAHYAYQESWFDIAARHDLVIDADNPDVSLLQAESTVIPNHDIVLSARATDATAPIVSVEYSTDGNTWRPATRDDDLWLFTYRPTASSGPVAIQVRATDAVGHKGQSSRTLMIDSAPPALTLSPALGASVLRPAFSAADNAWELALSGSALDANGAASVVIALGNESGIVGKPITLPQVNGAWSGAYAFPFAPNGRYTLEAYAVDAVGNKGAPARLVVSLDATAPIADVAVGQNTLGGPVGGGGAVQSRVAARPSSGPAPLAALGGTVSDVPMPPRALLSAHFEEASGATSFLDASPDQRRGTCALPGCPGTIAGYNGSGLSFDGANDTVAFTGVSSAADVPNGSFTIGAWLRPIATSSGSALSAALSGTLALDMRVAGGQLLASLVGAGGTATLDPAALTANEWNQVLLSYDGAQARLYVNGALVAQSAVSGGFGGFNQVFVGGQLGVGGFYAGDADELALYGTALSADQIRLMAAPVRSSVASVEVRLVHVKDFAAPETSGWNPAALAQNANGFATWSYDAPQGIEGPYRADLRTSDSKGNQQIVPNAWSGVIDTLAPRVALLAIPLGDGNTRVVCLATDYNLDENGFSCPAPRASWQRGYQAAPWFQELYSPTLQLETLRATALISTSAVADLRACDTFGYCATATPSATAQVAPGVSLVLTPGGTRLFSTLDPIALGGYASAGAGLQALEITAGNTTVDTRAPGGATELAWTSSFTPPGEGFYPIQARALAANGAVYTDTLAPLVVVDLAAPALSIGTRVVTSTGMLSASAVRVSGLVTETHGLAALAIRANAEPWQTLAPPVPGAARAITAALALGRSGPFDGEEATVELAARDVADRTAALTRTLVLDTLAPVAAGTAVTPSVTLAQIGGVATDGAGVARVEVGLLATADAGHPERTMWRDATLGAATARSTTWGVSVAAGGARSYSVALRLLDIHGNVRALDGVWSGDLFKLAPQFTGSAPANGSYGAAYSHTFAAGGDGPITFSVTGGELPPGLTLDATTGILTGTPALAGSYAFTITASSQWSPAASQAITVSIARAPLHVSVADASKVYGQPNPPLAFTPAPGELLNGDTASVITGTLATTASDGSGVGSYPISAGTLGAHNYALQVTPGTLHVTPATLTVTALSPVRRVFQPNPALTWSYGGFVNGDTPSVLTSAPVATTTATLDSLAGTYPISLSGALADNYRIAYVNGTLTVTDKEVPLIAWNAPAPIVYGTPLGAAQLNATASLNGQPVDGTLAYDPPLSTVLHAGSGQTLRVTFTPADTTNHATVSALVSIDVEQAELVASAQDETIRIHTPLPTLRYGLSGFVNGDTESVLTSAPLPSTTADNNLAGTYPIALSGGLAGDYRFIYRGATLTVTDKEVPLIAWNAPAPIVYGTPLSAAQLNATASLNGQPVDGTLAYDPPLGTVLHAGSGQTLRVTFTPADTTNHATVSALVSIDVEQAELVVTAHDVAIELHAALPTLRYTITGFVNGDDVADLDVGVRIATTADANRAGAYPITVSDAHAADYAITFVNATLTVRPVAPPPALVYRYYLPFVVK